VRENLEIPVIRQNSIRPIFLIISSGLQPLIAMMQPSDFGSTVTALPRAGIGQISNRVLTTQQIDFLRSLEIGTSAILVKADR
jgi:hypothetical protein